MKNMKPSKKREKERQIRDMKNFSTDWTNKKNLKCNGEEKY